MSHDKLANNNALKYIHTTPHDKLASDNALKLTTNCDLISRCFSCREVLKVMSCENRVLKSRVSLQTRGFSTSAPHQTKHDSMSLGVIGLPSISLHTHCTTSQPTRSISQPMHTPPANPPAQPTNQCTHSCIHQFDVQLIIKSCVQ